MDKVTEDQLKLEIAHIFDSGANEMRIFEMVKNFIDKRNLINRNDDVTLFFDNQLSIFRQMVKESKTSSEQDVNLRFCDATSYLKQMWLNK